MSITVYGYSDDLIEIEGDITEEFVSVEFNGPKDDGLTEGAVLGFSDGTVLRITFDGVWRISTVAVPNPDALKIVTAPEGDEANYSDRATLNGTISWVVCGSRVELAKD